MNAIVVTALKRPYTFVVLAILILLFGVMSVFKTPTDIFPPIKIPVVAAVWSYNGLMPSDMSGRVVYYYERALTTTVGNIEHIESQSLYGSGIVKIFFQPGTDVAAAQAQVTATSQTVIKQLPAGITPPNILVFDASSVPVLDLQIAADNMTPSDIYNLASNLIRPALVSVPGVAIPAPYGGTQADVEVDLDQTKLLEHGLSATDVGHALGTQNIVLPAGDQKIGPIDFLVSTNATPIAIDSFNNLPIKQVGNAVVYLRDVAYVHRGGPPQQNIVLVKGQQSILLQILKSGDASTLAVVSGVRAKLPALLKTLPPGVTITPLNDASSFVRASIADVVQEMVTAAFLAGITVLLFVGSWRSTLIVATSIPLSILSSILVLSWLGQTINVMTLGGLALAVGMLVDEGTVTLENIFYHLEMGKEVESAILDGAQQIVIPAFVTLLVLDIVFAPMFQLGGVAGYLFRPLAEAVVFALIGSFILSRTLVPTMARYLLRAHTGHDASHDAPVSRSRNPLKRFQMGFERLFTWARSGYRSLLAAALGYPKSVIVGFVAVVILSCGLWPFLGQNFFPTVDSGQILMHVRAQPGTRIEETARLFDVVEQTVRQIIPPAQLDNIVDNIGLPFSGINMAYQNTGTIGPEDGDALITLKEDHSPSEAFIKELRTTLPQKFPGTSFSFLPADIVSQILNFGLPAPIDVQVIGNNQKANYAYAIDLLKRIRTVPGIADLRIQQVFNYPQINVEVDRTLAGQVGLTQRDTANSLLVTLSGSGQVKPNFWLNTRNGVSYPIVAQMPQYRIDSMSDLVNLPITSSATKTPQYLGGLAQITPGPSPGVVSHYNVQPVIDIYGAVQGRDLGAVSGDIDRILQETHKDVPRGSYVVLSGQVHTMTSAYSELYFGLLGAIVLVYLVIVVNFQSWLDPFIIITALPGALAGIIWTLFMTGTTLSVPALTGAIMCMGIATANSVLLVSFAREGLAEGLDAATAALEAGFTRFRPVLMTALAMIIGMVPMAFALGEGGEQNAPLGRAVIGGLTVATVATLFFVPTVFSVLHRRRGAQHA
jgi:CzcA family heavy metal efflux pump